MITAFAMPIKLITVYLVNRGTLAESEFLEQARTALGPAGRRPTSTRW
ncbi:hypothetical protein AB0K00_40840 [Dactylosporangium sp. NPDC049525]